MLALADVRLLRYISARRFFHNLDPYPSDVTGDTSTCVLYLCTERILQDETCLLGHEIPSSAASADREAFPLPRGSRLVFFLIPLKYYHSASEDGQDYEGTREEVLG
jgi:hypothetical protein